MQQPKSSVQRAPSRRADGARSDVVVLHPERFVRDAVVAVLDGSADLRCVGTMLNGEPVAADAVLAGFHWLDRRAINEIDQLRTLLPDARLVAVVRTADEEHLTAAAALGAVVLPTGSPLELVLDCLRGHEIPLLRSWQREAERRAAESNLSARELQVLRLLGDGLTAESAARHLGITTHTCRDHLKAVRAKLNCSTTLQAVVTAARLGMLPGFAPAETALGRI